ncbi:MAG: hypothetical protein SVZ03_06035 [Spirochaetota bacterium]|nr:hypothetical protein [Spirochaetota bacterium]
MGKGEEYWQKLECQLQDLGSKILILTDKARSEVKTKYDRTLDDLRSKRNDLWKNLNENMSTQLSELSIKIDELASKARVEAKKEYNETIETLRIKRDEVAEKLEEQKNAGEKAFIEIKIGLKKSWDELKNALDNAISKFK